MSKSPTPLPPDQILRLSWTHLIELLRLADPWQRAFYENECLRGNWSVRQLQRQIGSLRYERTALSTDKQTVIETGRAQAQEAPSTLAATKVEYTTAGMDRQLFVSRYLVALPSPEQLQNPIEIDRAALESSGTAAPSVPENDS